VSKLERANEEQSQVIMDYGMDLELHENFDPSPAASKLYQESNYYNDKLSYEEEEGNSLNESYQIAIQ